MVKIKYKNYEDLTKKDKINDVNKENRVLFGRKNTLQRMIDNKNKKILELREEIKKHRVEQIEVKIKIKSLLDVNNFTPKISIHTTKKKGNLYYRGKINFGKNKPKQKQIPRNIENDIDYEIKEFLKSIYKIGKPKLSEEETVKLKKEKMKEWLLNWWREEGIMKRRQFLILFSPLPIFKPYENPPIKKPIIQLIDFIK